MDPDWRQRNGLSEKILIRDLTDYHIEWTTSEQDAGFRSNTRWEFTGQTFQNGVANWLKSNLGESSAAFDVGGESCRKYLNFSGKVLNSETLEWSPISPTFKITRSTNWEHQWPAWWSTEVCTELYAVLAEVRRQQEDAEKRRVEYTLGEQVKARLDALCKKIPALQVVHAWTVDDWESTLFELLLLVKGVSGGTQAAALWMGRNGKDTLCNIMQAVLGSYAVSMAAQTLSRIRDPSAPSPAYALCRARRFVAIREIDKCEPIRQQLYKVFTDPKSELTGRDMYEKMVQFKPQFLLFLASNDPPALVNDLANRERTNVVEHVSVFHDRPVEANHAQWKDIEATLETSEGKAEYFALFYAVFHQLLWQNPRRRISHPNAWLSWKRRCMTPS